MWSKFCQWLGRALVMRHGYVCGYNYGPVYQWGPLRYYFGEEDTLEGMLFIVW